MNPIQWARVKELFAAALELEKGEKRTDFLNQACPEDSAVRAETERLLDEHDRVGNSFLKTAAQSEITAFLEAPRPGPRMAPPEPLGTVATGTGIGSGSRIGPYQIEAPLGAGGMGEVYRARDTRLGRAVAIKFIYQRFSPRFQREAQAISRLNHPNICTLYDIGPDYLVMEWIDGNTLKDRIATGPLGLDETLDIVCQLAQGLRAAHNCGILHRDIKPANVMVTLDGRVKIMDFGLAKLSGSVGLNDDTGAGSLTVPGAVMGTPPYMSPEQAAGRPVDHRADIWSLGVVFYELVTGQRPFRGESGLPVLRAILDDQPQPVSDLRPGTRPEISQILQKALAKDPLARYQQVGEMLADLLPLLGPSSAGTGAAQQTGASHGTRAVSSAITDRASFSRRSIFWIMAFLALVLLAVAAAFYRRENTPADSIPQRVVALTSDPGNEDNGSFSPDGTQIAFVWDGPRQDNLDIYIKSVDGSMPRRLTTDPDLEFSPAWSPDGRWIAFIRGDGVFLISPLGGPERRLATLDADALAWTSDGKSLAMSARVSKGELNSVYLISLAGGEAKRLTTPVGSLGDRDPSFSPDGKSLAFVRWNAAGCGVNVCEFLENSCGNPRALTRDSEIYGLTWTPEGREIVFAANRNGVQTLWRVPANSSSPARIVPGLPGNARRPAISRSARETRDVIPTHLAYTQKIHDYNIWRMDLRAAGLSRRKSIASPLITSTKLDIAPEFSPDVRRIVFVSDRSGSKEIWVSDSDGSNPQQLTFFGSDLREGAAVIYADGSPRWSPDGLLIAFHVRANGKRSIHAIGAHGDSPRRVSPEPFEAWRPAWSKDGRWLYFTSNRESEASLWKVRVDGSEAPVRVSKGVGYDASESPDGKLLYFFDEGGRWQGDYSARGSTLWSMPVTGGPQVAVLQGVQPMRWAIVDKGIYFLDINSELPGRPDLRSIKFFSFQRRSIEEIGVIEKRSLPSWKSNSYAASLAVSPDNRWILWPQLDRDESDLMLVRDFR